MGQVDLDGGTSEATELVFEDKIARVGEIAAYGGIAQAAIVGCVEGRHNFLGQRRGQVSQSRTRVEDDGLGADAVVLGDAAGVAVDGCYRGQSHGEGGVVVGGGILDDGHGDQVAGVFVRVDTTKKNGSC